MLFKSWLLALSLLALLMVGACTVTSTGGGTLQVTWTLNNAQDPNQCATLGAQNVAVTLTDANGFQSGAATVSCSSLGTTFSGLSSGVYNVTADLLDVNGAVLLTSNSQVTVSDGATSQDIIPFAGTTVTGAGTLTVSWTVASSATAAACASANASTIQISVYNSANVLVQAPISEPCTAFALSIPNLPADTYSLTAQLFSANGAAATTSAPAAGIVITAGATQVQAVDFPTSSFETGTQPTGGTGSIAVTWTLEEGMATASCGDHNAASISIQLYQADGVTPYSSPVELSCVAFQGTLTSIAPGSYTIGAQLVNTTRSVTTAIPPVAITVTDGGTATQSFDFPSSSFTN